MDCPAGLLHKEEGRLVYPVTDKESEKGSAFKRFENETIYRLKVRAKKPEPVLEGITRSSQNQFLVVEIIEKNPSCPALEEILAEYQKPIVLQDNTLGKLTLDKKSSWFNGKISWQNKMVDIFLEVNKNSKSSWTKARKAMTAMLSQQDKWDKDMRVFAANQFTDLACEWRESADETALEITKESFANRLKLQSLCITASGTFSAHFDDDDMFFGHCVTVHGSLKKGVTSADMAG